MKTFKVLISNKNGLVKITKDDFINVEVNFNTIDVNLSFINQLATLFGMDKIELELEPEHFEIINILKESSFEITYTLTSSGELKTEFNGEMNINLLRFINILNN